MTMKVECPTCKALCEQDAELCHVCGQRLPKVVSLVSDRPRRPVAPRPQALDQHGQPCNPNLNLARRTERDLSELIGLVKGMLVDGVVSHSEATYLRAWGMNHPDALRRWPTQLIFSRLEQFFLDGRIDDDERSELQELLAGLIGGTASLLLGYEGGTTLPLCRPAPPIYFHDATYVFTGKFAYGTRHTCEDEVIQRGGICEKNPTQHSTFLVIGTFGSLDWIQSNYGRKIEKAVHLRASGTGLKIVGEDHWASALGAAAL